METAVSGWGPRRAGHFLLRHSLAWLGLALLLWPIPLAGPAPHPFDFHRVAFCIGPALYKYGPGLLPGPDLFSQYGAGQGFVFGFLLDESTRATVDNFYVLFLAVMLVTFVLAYHFLAYLLNSRAWAFSVSLLALFLQFNVPDFGHGQTFSVMPATGLYRVPLLIPVAWLFAGLCRRNSAPGAAVQLGSVLGLALFWSTDTGLASWCACLGSAIVLCHSIVRAVRTALVLTAVMGFAFLALSAAAYGTGALNLRYLGSLLAPWTWYTGGELSLNKFAWELDNGHFASLATLFGCLAVIGYFSTRFRSSPHRIPFAAGSLVFLAFISVFLHAKCTVRPFIWYWGGTALPGLAVMAWALKKFLPPLYRRALAALCPRHLAVALRFRAPQLLTVFTAVLCCAWVALGFTDRLSEHASCGWRCYWSFNSALNVGIKAALARAGIPEAPPGFIRPNPVEDLSGFPTAADVALIQGNTEPGERTALISWCDWAFLLEAKRPPRYFALPMPTASYYGSLTEGVRRVTESTRVLFVDKRVKPMLKDACPDWESRFQQAGESDNLVLLRTIEVRPQ